LGYADTSGKVVIRPRYKYAESFSEGLAVVGDEAEFWYIDTRGDDAFPGKFAAASPFFKGLAHVRFVSPGSAEANEFAYIDRNGQPVFRY
jgi:hypothetical protein